MDDLKAEVPHEQGNHLIPTPQSTPLYALLQAQWFVS